MLPMPWIRVPLAHRVPFGMWNLSRMHVALMRPTLAHPLQFWFVLSICDGDLDAVNAVQTDLVSWCTRCRETKH